MHARDARPDALGIRHCVRGRRESASRVPRDNGDGQPESSCRQPFRVVGDKITRKHRWHRFALKITDGDHPLRSTRHRGMRSSLDQNQIHRLVRLTAGPRHHDVATAGSSPGCCPDGAGSRDTFSSEDPACAGDRPTGRWYSAPPPQRTFVSLESVSTVASAIRARAPVPLPAPPVRGALGHPAEDVAMTSPAVCGALYILDSNFKVLLSRDWRGDTSPPTSRRSPPRCRRRRVRASSGRSSRTST